MNQSICVFPCVALLLTQLFHADETLPQGQHISIGSSSACELFIHGNIYEYEQSRTETF